MKVKGNGLSLIYKQTHNKKIIIIVILLITLLVITMACTTLGVTDSKFSTTFIAVKKYFSNIDLNTSEKVVLNLRLPRTLLAIFAGIGLSISGVIMQGITRNPLVSPFTIGTSSASAFGASLAIVFGISFFDMSELAIVTNAFLMAMLCTLLVFFISKNISSKSQTLVLSGIALNYLFQALTSIVQFFADDASLSRLVSWTFGSVNGALWIQVKIVTFFVLLCFSIIYKFSREFTLVATIDDDLAKTMGVNPELLRLFGVVVSSLATSIIISFTGVIGFVGLASPHISRSLIGNNYRYLLPTSGIVGALLILISDTIGRLVIFPIIIPVGIIVSFVGIPIFLNLVISSRRL